MCGIVGYVGSREAGPLLVGGLKRLEYRGYDSCGIAVLNNGTAAVARSSGRVAQLEQKLAPLSFFSSLSSGIQCGIGHTRWATHGRPSEENAHPHRDCSGRFLVAHNGIIENYGELRRRLSAAGHRFTSETDTEVLPHLIESLFEGNLERAVRAALGHVAGVYALVAASPLDGAKLVAARKGPPLVIGRGEGENFLASDVPAILPFTRDVLFLSDDEIAVVRSDRVELRDLSGARIDRQTERIDWSSAEAEKGGYPHFMLKEIFEQPRAVRSTLSGRIAGDDLVGLDEELADLDSVASAERLFVVACGTSLHAALIGKFMIESLAGIPVEVDHASEFRYRRPLVRPRTTVIAISQSGETADTLAALAEAGERGAKRLAICNVVGSMAARQSDSVLYTRAGPEIGVASTKAFTAQLTALYLLALALGRRRDVLSPEAIRQAVRQLRRVPDQMEDILAESGAIKSLAERFCSYRNFLYLGRGVNYPVAMEGALKLKEISYIHAEGYPAGEMKHGPIALIDQEMPVLVLAPRDHLYRKTMSNIEEIKSRGGMVLALASEGDAEIGEKADQTIFIPPNPELLNPLTAVVPLQLFAYHVAVVRGCDVDKPRNLAKSVTVE